jgi:WD40-like Beta Propeller Repeat
MINGMPRFMNCIRCGEGACSPTSLRWLFGLALSHVAALGASAQTRAPEWSVSPVSSVLSSPAWESHPAFDPMSGDVWFVRSDASFSGWRLWMARCRKGKLSDPLPVPLAAPGLEADPFFTPDGQLLYFISTRQTGAMKSSALDIWLARRDRRGGWSRPARLPSPVNSAGAEWFPRLSADGWLYFGSNRSGGLGGTDIWRAKTERSGQWRIENAGPAVNGPSEDYEFEPAPDGRSALLATDRGIFLLRFERGRWQPRVPLGSNVNGNGSEIGPLWERDGSSFWFSRDLGGARSGEFLFANLKGKPNRHPPLGRCTKFENKGNK